MFVNQTRLVVEALRERYAGRAHLRALARELPPARCERLHKEGLLPGDTSVVLALAGYEGRNERIAQKIFDFSQRSIADRWQEGVAQGCAILERLRRVAKPEPASLLVLGTDGPSPPTVMGPDRTGASEAVPPAVKLSA